VRIIHIKQRDAGFEKFKDRDLLRSVVEFVRPDKGINYRDMKAAIELADKIMAAGDAPLMLEDTDWKSLCEKLEAYPFGIVDRDLHDLIQSVVDAPFVKPEDVSAQKNLALVKGNAA
jgi:hypothetical protein